MSSAIPELGQDRGLDVAEASRWANGFRLDAASGAFAWNRHPQAPRWRKTLDPRM